MEHEGDVSTNCNWCSWHSHQRIGSGTEGLRNNRTSGDYPNYSIVKINQKTEKSPGDLWRIAVTYIPVKDHSEMTANKTQE